MILPPVLNHHLPKIMYIIHYPYAMDNVVKEKEKLGFGICVTFSSVNIGLLVKRTTNAKVCCTAF